MDLLPQDSYFGRSRNQLAYIHLLQGTQSTAAFEGEKTAHEDTFILLITVAQTHTSTSTSPHNKEGQQFKKMYWPALFSKP